ncbi:MAG: dUTPase [Candidatus Nitrosocosmicus sp.]|nr:dUTPase [Candidatus Nitrosocosmicus sp.]MDN5867377.1 dUTPase [Candidatus Nitrosocosmicus sp.]
MHHSTSDPDKVHENKDKLEYLFELQKSLITQDYDSTKIKGSEKISEENSPENKMKKLYEMKEPFSGYRIFMISSALVHEAIELQRETNWKWWKKDKTIDNEKLQEEIIDLWHFLIQISIEVGFEPQTLISKYMEKNKENTGRQLRGY